MPNVTRDDIYLDQSCATCGETIIIIPAHGFFVQHEDAEIEADHRVTALNPANSVRSTPGGTNA
jgi:hypothetical protein